MIYIGSVSEVELNADGLPIFAVLDGMGNRYYPCTFVSNAGGTDGMFSMPAIRVGARVILAQNTGGSGHSFFILGFLPDTEDSLAISMDGVSSAILLEKEKGRGSRSSPDVKSTREGYTRNSDYSGVHIEDFHVENEDSFVNLSQPHGITLTGYPRVSVQIPEDTSTACFRVSAGGQASNTLLNAHPHLDRLFNYLATIEAKVVALENAVVGTLTADALTAFNEGVALNTNLAGSGVTQIALSEDLTAKAAAITSTVIPTTASQVREESNEDINPYVIIP